MHTRASVFGWPTSIRSDDGLQFCEDFPRFCNKQGIRNELSAPYNPKSNGLAEAGVKSIKNILHECLSSGADPPTTCYTNGVMFPVWMASVPRNLCLVVANGLACPLPSQITPIDFDQAASSKDSAHACPKLDHDRLKLSLPALSPGQSVFLQDSKPSSWDIQGTIVSIRTYRLSYVINVDNRFFTCPHQLTRPVALRKHLGK